MTTLDLTPIISCPPSVCLAFWNEKPCPNSRPFPCPIGFRRVAGRATDFRIDQSARAERGSSLGALVLELPGGIEKRRLALGRESKSAGGSLFRLRLERRPGRARYCHQ